MSATAEAPSEVTAKTVLIVDDSSAMRQFLSSIVRQLPNCVAVEAANGLEALRLLHTRQFDLLLVDINMPVMNGLELIGYCKRHPLFRDVPIIVITTQTGAEDRRRALALGADEYLVKPVTPEQVLNIITHVMTAEAQTQ